MWCRPSAKTRRCQAVLLLLVLCAFWLSAVLLARILLFRRSMLAHTVSERDLPPAYQQALNASLHTEPCCERAQWTPSAQDVEDEQIPRIIHQTFKTREIPEGDWQTAHDQCLTINPTTDGWRHILWTDETIEKFIAIEFPEFLSTFKAYPYPIQRVDAMRYFILHHYGGIYLDLDIGCARSMLSLLQFPAFFPLTRPLGVSNDLMGSRKGHPFMYELGQALLAQGPGMRYGTMYLTVFFTTGPMFVNRILARYWRRDLAENDRVLILPANFYSESLTAYFMHFPGSSWHGNDANSVILVYTYGWIALLVMVSAYLGYVARGCSCSRLRRLAARRRGPPSHTYYKLKNIEEEHLIG